MPSVKFFYNGNRSPSKEVVITNLVELVSKVIELPETIEVCIYPLNDNVYGGIDTVNVNRLFINSMLNLEEIPVILVHELIHVNQKHTGILKIINNIYYWHGVIYKTKPPEKMSHNDYLMLPWEIDVKIRQKNVIKQAMDLFKKG